LEASDRTSRTKSFENNENKELEPIDFIEKVIEEV
jgi:hypothetical protein